MADSEFNARRRRFERYGVLACVVFVLLVVMASTLISITGAVTAIGYVVQTGENKSVQHPEGGPVAEVLVQEGDLVEAGQPLILLDGAVVASQHRILTRREFELTVRLERLRALESGATDFDFSLPDGKSESVDRHALMGTAESATAKQSAWPVGHHVHAWFADPTTRSPGWAAGLVAVTHATTGAMRPRAWPELVWNEPARGVRTRANADADASFRKLDVHFAREVVATQKSVFDSYRRRLESLRRRLTTRELGLETEIAALDRQVATNRRQVALLDDEIQEISDLVDEKLVSKARLTGLQRQKVGVEAQIDSLMLGKARTQNALTDTRNELAVMNRENQELLWRQIEETQAELEEVMAELTAARDRLSRLVITAPAAGRVHELTIRNVNAVVASGEVILQIVPVDAAPVVNARVRLIDIDQVHPGQHVRIRFDTFDMRTTPEIQGSVLRIAADRSVDPQTGETYYSVLVELPPGEISKLDQNVVIPGLPASAMFTTRERTLLDYLTKPLRDQLFAAFRDE